MNVSVCWILVGRLSHSSEVNSKLMSFKVAEMVHGVFPITSSPGSSMDKEKRRFFTEAVGVIFDIEDLFPIGEFEAAFLHCQ